MICLSFDTDHLDDRRIHDFVAEVAIPGRATFFCTHRYETLGDDYELCPHAVLERGAWDAPLDAAAEAFPHASGFRAHGCLHSHSLALELHNRGYRYASAQAEFGREDIEPYREAWGIWHMPIYYMDTLDISHGRHWPDRHHETFASELLENALSGPGLYVFAFHPIHLLLNTVTPEGYLERRDSFIAGEPLGRIREGGRGVRGFYDDLIRLMRDKGVESRGMAEALDEFTATPSGAGLG